MARRQVVGVTIRLSPGFVIIAAVLLSITGGTYPVRAGASFEVDTPLDAVDANPGDGVCATAADQCSLRAAVQEANAQPGADTIALSNGTYSITITGSGDGPAAAGDLDVTDDLTVGGNDASLTVIDGTLARDRAFAVAEGVTVNISDLAIQHFGYPPDCRRRDF